MSPHPASDDSLSPHPASDDSLSPHPASDDSLSPHLAPDDSQLSFVRKFSTINVTNNQSLMRPDRTSNGGLADITGHNRNTPTFFKVSCKNSSKGCLYQNGSLWLLDVHEGTCKADQLLKYAFPCSRPGCLSGFESQRKLNAHEKEQHQWKPQKCAKCNHSDTFNTSSTYRAHITKVHSGFVPTGCSVPGCSSKTTFQMLKTYVRHLTKVHGLDGKERYGFYDRGERGIGEGEAEVEAEGEGI
ncbi:hypothetical protein VE02_03858 [Pseudogymnoascus sp. 03VT05]|nr:hypothetical protein VE02_03858 [Pseudogymnoascus sp. 03VT05]